MDVKLDYKERWALENWCFWTGVLEKILESPMDCKEIQPVHPKGNQSWIVIGRTDVEAETLILWPPDVRTGLIGKGPGAERDWGQKEKGATVDYIAGWPHNWMNMSLSKLQEIVKGREAWRAAVHRVTKSQTWLNNRFWKVAQSLTIAHISMLWTMTVNSDCELWLWTK